MSEFHEVIHIGPSEDEYNHIQSTHTFIANPGDEQVGSIIVTRQDGTLEFHTPKSYVEKFKLPLLSGRTRTLGVRIIFDNEEGFSWYKDIYFHKGMTYTESKYK